MTIYANIVSRKRLLACDILFRNFYRPAKVHIRGISTMLSEIQKHLILKNEVGVKKRQGET
jgi:hypothetical protein